MKLLCLSAFALAVLSACGGGGSDALITTSATFNADAAFATLLSAPNSFSNLTARDSAGNSYALSFSFTPAPDFIFNGAALKQSVQNSSLSKNGAAVPGERFSTQYLYSLNATKLLTIIRAGRNAGFSPIIYSPTVYTSISSLPTAGIAGSSGTLATGISYSAQLDQTGTTGSAIAGNAPLVWSIEADTATTAFACLSTPVEKDCLKINSAGVISGARATIQVGTEALTFQ
jgi:hypothetical protein